MSGADMLKETVGVAAGAALILSPLGIPLASCGLPGLIVAGAGLFLVDAVMKDINGAREKAGIQATESEDVPSSGDRS